MKKIIPYLTIILSTVFLVFTSCDRRGTSSTNISSEYYLEVFAFDSVSVPDQLVQIGCFVTDYTGEQLGGVQVNFEVIGDFGAISPNRESSADDTVDGLITDLYFQPQGGYGAVEIVASIPDEANPSVTEASDTTAIEVYPYNLELWAESNSIPKESDTHIYCRALNPFNNIQTGNIDLAFGVENDFGSITPTAKSDADSQTGLQSNVIYTAPNSTGVATIVAAAKYNYASPYNMGSDTLQITVTSN